MSGNQKIYAHPCYEDKWLEIHFGKRSVVLSYSDVSKLWKILNEELAKANATTERR